MKRAGSATVAAAAAVALAAGLTSPASATAEQSRSAAGATGSASAAGSVVKNRITLITGDRVLVDGKGRVVGLEPAKGREKIPVQVRQIDGRVYAVPADASRLIESGKLDRRLFDITELNKSATRKAQKNGLKVIVGYRGAASATKEDVRDASTVRRTLKALNAQAVQAPKDDTAGLWDALTNGDSTASGIAHVWLDGVRKVTLDKSVPQIGAPKAWERSYDGEGVTIAVLDTGVDTTHPDLKDQVSASKNFTDAAGTDDKFGHGTHVASIAAGTGAKSGGKLKGVAPKAKVLNGKVLNDSGFGDDSGILAGMEWAAEQNADIVNMSLGGTDGPEIDPLEAAVNRLTAEKGVLFAIAAGNDGPGAETVGSPGSAEAALTVGAVDDADKLAEFSSTGPRVGDGGLKPDVTAPGVAITAASAKGSLIAGEVGENPPGYLTIDGTSMATPHVAGAAAILKEQHPDWTAAQLKGALTASTKGGAYTAFQQGSGRIQVDKAIDQTVVAEPASVSFGTQQWPHTDDTPVTKKVTYRNLGTKDITLSLSAKGVNPKGQAAPAGFFTLAADKVTVPAGGTASVDVTADTRIGGTVDGAYSAFVTATDGAQSVRTAAAVNREVESYDLTIKHLDRDGKDTTNYGTSLVGVAGLADGQWLSPHDENSGTVTVRVPKGTYVLDSAMWVDAQDFTKGADWVAQPKLDVTSNTTVTVDARTTKPISVSVPDSAATSEFASPSYSVDTPTGSSGFGWWLDSYKGFRSAHLGPQITDGSLYQQWDAHWVSGTGKQYSTTAGGETKKLATGYTKNYKLDDLAAVKVAAGAAAAGKTGSLSAVGWPKGSWMASAIAPELKLPADRLLYLSAQDGVKWDLGFSQYGGVDEYGFPVLESDYTVDQGVTFKAGTSYSRTVHRAVFGPTLTSGFGLYRDGNELSGVIPLFADSQRNAGLSDLTSVDTTLYRNGTKVGSNKDPLVGEGVFKVPSADAEYRLTTSVKRSVKVAAASTRIDASWTFRSKKTGAETLLPASTVRFDANTDLSSKVTAGRNATVPVVVEGAAKGSNLKSLSVYVSYDYGQTWKKLKVKNGKVTVKNPAKGKAISYHAKITDKKNNKSTISIYNAYYGK
ncbi:S8 family peptidase [Streptomyces sp. NPDC091377]|uniref:S8 family peptidase n=1 Tax=Streptomyces sp. NPDC091377 TaxID=3365995 RepID=UPI00381A10FA